MKKTSLTMELAINVHKNRWILGFALLALCGFSCAPSSGGAYVAVPDDADFGARNAAWDKDPCVDFDESDCQGNPMQCICSDREGYEFTDQNVDSPYHGQAVSPSSFGKANLWGYYWAECGTCIQQIGYLQTLKDTLAEEGFEVEIVAVAYRGDVVGTLGQSPRAHSYACQGARRELPSCRETCADPSLETCQIRLDSPAVATGRGAITPDPSRGDWFIYRADGKLFEFIASEEREDQNGFLGNAINWEFTKARLKAAVMAPTNGVQPCSPDFACTHEGQWCQYPDGQCGGRGTCVTSDLPANVNHSMGLVEQVCNADGRRPVCTCEGNSYSSRCDAELDEENISHQGACE